MVRTLDEIMKAGHKLLDAELPPAEHDPLVAFEALAACEWWGWHELQSQAAACAAIRRDTDSTD